MRRFGIHFAAVCVGQSEDIAGKLDGDALHAQADAERRDVVLAGIFGGNELAGDAAFAEARADEDTGLVFQGLGHVVFRQLLAVDEVHFHLAVVVGAGLREGFADGLVGVLQVVFAHQGDVQCRFLLGLVASFQERTPRAQSRGVAHGQSHLLQDGGIQLLCLHQDGHLVDGGGVNALHHGILVHVAELGHLLAQVGVQLMFGAEYEDVRLDTGALQLLDGVLRGLGLQFAGSGQVGDVGQVDDDGVAAQFPLQLADALQVGQGLDVAHGAANLGDDEVELVFVAQLLDVALDFVRDVRDDLNGLAQVVAAAFLIDNALIDAAGGDVVCLGGLNAQEAFVVSQVEVSLVAVHGDVALAVLVGVQRARVDVDVRVEFLDGYVIASGLQQLANGGGDDAFSQGRGHSAGDENVLSFSHSDNIYKCLFYYSRCKGRQKLEKHLQFGEKHFSKCFGRLGD